MENKVSIVIPTYNQTYLKDTLDSICEQSNYNFEVNLIENGKMNHGTLELLNNYKSKILINYTFERIAGLNRARNIGVRLSRYDIIALTDDDCILGRDWIANIIESHNENQHAGVIGGRVDLTFPDKRPSWLIPPLSAYLAELDWGGSIKVLEDREYLVGANMSFTKKMFILANGFDEDVGLVCRNFQGCDEFTFSEKLKNFGSPGLVYNPSIKVKHQVPNERARIDYLEQRAYGQGVSEALLNRKRLDYKSQIEFLEDQLYGQEWNWKKLKSAEARLQDTDLQEFKMNFLRCRLLYIIGIKDVLITDI